jgi:hypothetical protein
MKPTVVSAGNTVVPAHLALQARGYAVWREEPVPGGEATWFAEDARRRFAAEDPVALLGLVAMFDIRGDDWAATDEEIDRFVAEFGGA